jgi:hypothetical protein
VLSNGFPGRVVLATIISWCEPMPSFVWHFDTVYKNNPHTINEMQKKIWSAVINVVEQSLAAVSRNFRRGLWTVWDADSAHFENVLRRCQSSKAAEPSDIKYSNTRYVVRDLYTIKAERLFRKTLNFL